VQNTKFLYFLRYLKRRIKIMKTKHNQETILLFQRMRSYNLWTPFTCLAQFQWWSKWPCANDHGAFAKSYKAYLSHAFSWIQKLVKKMQGWNENCSYRTCCIRKEGCTFYSRFGISRCHLCVFNIRTCVLIYLTNKIVVLYDTVCLYNGVHVFP
jgi:hypothetical protein